MKLHPDYFNNFLYPLQNKVLQAIEEAQTDFYLTGGTALSRGYIYHPFEQKIADKKLLINKKEIIMGLDNSLLMKYE